MPRRLMPSSRVGSIPPDEFGRDDLPPIGQAIEHRLHLRRVPCQHDVRQQTQRVGHRLRLVDTLGLPRTNPPGVRSALQGVDRLSAVEYSSQFAKEGGVDEVVR